MMLRLDEADVITSYGGHGNSLDYFGQFGDASRLKGKHVRTRLTPKSSALSDLRRAWRRGRSGWRGQGEGRPRNFPQSDPDFPPCPSPPPSSPPQNPITFAPKPYCAGAGKRGQDNRRYLVCVVRVPGRQPIKS